MVFIDTDEKLDTVPGTDLKLIQKIDGTAFAIDTLLLANFLKFNNDIKSLAELGSGNGILSFLVKWLNPDIAVTGFELQSELHELSLRNCSLNQRFDIISFENMDVRDLPSRFLPESFDMVVSNPPYFKAGEGRLPKSQSRAYARHELNGTLKDFIEAAVYLLSYGGRFSFVIPSSRFNETYEYLKQSNMGLKRLQFVHPSEGQSSHLCFIDSEKFYNGKHEPVPSFCIHLKDGSYSPELERLFKNGPCR